MFKLGLSSGNLSDVKVELDRNGRSTHQYRTVKVNYKGHTRIQMGKAYRVWQGTLAFDTVAERDFLRSAYRQRIVWFQDDTPEGAGTPVKVLWQGSNSPQFDEPTTESGRMTFRFEEVSSE